MRDPYTVLGVSKSADAAEIKKAFRKLAKKYHPDQSTDPKAKDKFAEVGAAYEILGDEKKRAAFDRGEIDAEGKPRFHGFEGFEHGMGGGRRPGGGFESYEFNFGGKPGGQGFGTQGFDASDLFSDLFSGATSGRRSGRNQAPPRGEDVNANVTVSLADSVKGAKTRVTLPTGKTLEITIPAGIEDGKQIRLKGQGQPSPFGGETGDALVTVHVTKHPYFRVDGHDLRLDLPITLYEAVLGAKVNVPTLDGMVELNVPAGSNGGQTLRLRGKGLPSGDGKNGDLFATLRIVLPKEKEADPNLVTLMQEWEKSRPYHPRSDLT